MPESKLASVSQVNYALAMLAANGYPTRAMNRDYWDLGARRFDIAPDQWLRSLTSAKISCLIQTLVSRRAYVPKYKRDPKTWVDTGRSYKPEPATPLQITYAKRLMAEQNFPTADSIDVILAAMTKGQIGKVIAELKATAPPASEDGDVRQGTGTAPSSGPRLARSAT